ncbi:MAG TPA: hypothetical protein VLJ62_24435, partial [Burkholderiaceae bacterium]|nr:hypothetical protein [Burkholderiaceae bacterium]
MNELLTAFMKGTSMRLHRCALVLAACLLAACGGSGPDDSTFLDELGKSFRIGPNPAELTIAAGERASATLVLNCVFNDPAIDISVSNGAELARAKLVVVPRRADRQCDRATGEANGAGQPLYDGTVSWLIVALDDAAPGRYEVHFLAEALRSAGSNTERTTLIVVVTAPPAGGFTLDVPADVLVTPQSGPGEVLRQQASIPITVARAEHSGAIDLVFSAVDAQAVAIPKERLVTPEPETIAPAQNAVTATVRYDVDAELPLPQAGERVIVSAIGGGVARAKAVRLRGDSLVPPVPQHFAASAT